MVGDIPLGKAQPKQRCQKSASAVEMANTDHFDGTADVRGPCPELPRGARPERCSTCTSGQRSARRSEKSRAASKTRSGGKGVSSVT